MLVDKVVLDNRTRAPNALWRGLFYFVAGETVKTYGTGVRFSVRQDNDFSNYVDSMLNRNFKPPLRREEPRISSFSIHQSMDGVTRISHGYSDMVDNEFTIDLSVAGFGLPKCAYTVEDFLPAIAFMGGLLKYVVGQPLPLDSKGEVDIFELYRLPVVKAWTETGAGLLRLWGNEYHTSKWLADQQAMLNLPRIVSAEKFHDNDV